MASSSDALRGCCNCGDSGVSRQFRSEGRWSLLECTGCGLVFLPGAGAEPESFLSAPPEYWGYLEYYRKYQDIFEGFFEERLRRIRRFSRAEPSSLLDIGAGYGLWLQFCKSRVSRVAGIELNAQAAETASEHFGLHVIPGDCQQLDQLGVAGPFDAITLCDVLEHLEDPAGALAQIRNHLAPDGLLYVQVPNQVAPSWPRSSMDQLGLPHHLWHFRLESLGVLLAKAGFEIEAHWTGIQGIIGAHEKGEATLLRRACWKTASLLKRGNRLQVMARVRQISRKGTP